MLISKNAIYTHFFLSFSFTLTRYRYKISTHLYNHEERREGSGPMTARQPYPKGTKARNNEANDEERNNKAALRTIFQF